MMLAWPNRADLAGLDLGSWTPTLPLANLRNPVLAIKARSLGTTLAATKFRVNMPMDYAGRVLCLANHNLSFTARFRLRASNAPDLSNPLHDSGWRSAYDAVDSLDLEWEDDHFWTGGVSADDLEGARANLIYILPVAVQARYWLVELDDQYNAAGYVEVGRLFICPVWQPVRNLTYGASLEWVSRTNVAEAAGGSEYFEPRQAYRVARGQLPAMATEEALGTAYEFQRRMDLSGQFVFVWDPADILHRRRRAFPARLRQLSAIEHPYFDTYSMPVEIKEIL